MTNPVTPDSQDNSKSNFCLCINPDCSDPKRSIQEKLCQACGSDLFLKEQYLVTGIVHQRDKFAAVFDVIDLHDPEIPKVLKVLYTNDPEKILRFDREADFLINHYISGIPRVDRGGYFCANFPNNPTPAYCLVMEKIEGHNLQEWLESRNNQPIGELEAIDWLQQLVQIIGQLHGEKFFHRDIKPSNIMRRERDGKLFLIDLGAVRAVTQSVLEGNTITTVGTYGYMAPEQTKGRAVPQSDFYALGATFVYLLTGIHPHKLEEKVPGSLHWEPRAVQISNLLANFINFLMAWLPNERPQNTNVILEKLEKIKYILKATKIRKIEPSFKKIFGFIVTCFLGYLSLLSIEEGLQKPAIIPTPSVNSRQCRIRENGTFDASALALDAKKAINAAFDSPNIYPEINKFNSLNQFIIGQKKCTVIVYIRSEGNEYTDRKLQEELEEIIMEHINPEAKDIVNLSIQPSI